MFAVTSYDHKAGDDMENDPEGSESESLGNILLLYRKELRFVVIGSSDWHTNCSGPNFDPPPLPTHGSVLFSAEYSDIHNEHMF